MVWRSDPKPPKREKKVKQPLKRTRIKKKFKPSGERAVFKFLWDTKPHICEHCNVPLGNTGHAWNFAHKIRKSKNEAQRLNPDNIMLHCLSCHQELDQGTKEGYEMRKNLYKKQTHENI